MQVVLFAGARAGGCPWTARKGRLIAPPMSSESACSRKCSTTPIFSATLAPPSTATSGLGGDVQERAEGLELALHEPPGGAGQQVRDSLCACAVRGAEGVVDVEVRRRGQTR